VALTVKKTVSMNKSGTDRTRSLARRASLFASSLGSLTHGGGAVLDDVKAACKMAKPFFAGGTDEEGSS
jgi:hypothetical protein